jgi:predicted transcriptional regulator
MILAADVLKVLSNEESLELFGIVAATTDSNTDIIISKIKLTRKQYYFRMSKLMKAGLIKKKNRKDSFTTFGKVVYNIQMKIENAVNNYWKLKTIDLLEDFHTLSTTERKKIIYDGF